MNSKLFLQNTKYLFIVLTVVFTSSCAAPPKPPTYLVPTYTVTKDYKALGNRATFEKDNLVISIKALTPDDDIKNGTFSALKENNYIFLELTFINKTEKRVTYNSSFTHLMGAHFDYRKPLNYTDLYSISVGRDHDLSKEKDLKALRGKYYDHMTRIQPKEKTTRYLIFKPNKKETVTAVLTMKEIYIGTKTISVSFPFDTEFIEIPEEELSEGTTKETP